MAVAQGYEVENENGDVAWYDTQTKRLYPIPRKVVVQPGTQLRKGDMEAGIRQTQMPEAQTTARTQELGQRVEANTAAMTQPSPEAKVQRAQADLRATQPYEVENDKGDVAMYDPTTKQLTPKQKGGMLESLHRGEAGAALQKYGPAVTQFVLGMIPGARGLQMAFGAGMGALDPAESISERAKNAVIGAVTPLVGEVAGKAVKAGVRQTSKFMSPNAMRAAGNAEQQAAKAITTPVSSMPTLASELQSLRGSVKTPDKVWKELDEHITKINNAVSIQGKPFDYGDFFEHANQISQKATKYYNQAAGQATGKGLDRVSQAIMKDLSALGPEAKQASEAWKNAVGGVGGWSGAQKLWTAISATGGPTAVGALIGSGVGAGAAGAGAVVSALSGLMVRAPMVGQALARSLITPDGLPVKAAMPALAQLVKDHIAEARSKRGND